MSIDPRSLAQTPSINRDEPPPLLDSAMHHPIDLKIHPKLRSPRLKRAHKRLTALGAGALSERSRVPPSLVRDADIAIT